MSLSIDYITMPPKSQEVSQIQHGDQVRYEHSQQEVASQVQQQVHQNSHQTIRRAKAENKDYLNEEEKRRGKRAPEERAEIIRRNISRRRKRIREQVEAFLI